jgi:hypothetical protein
MHNFIQKILSVSGEMKSMHSIRFTLSELHFLCILNFSTGVLCPVPHFLNVITLAIFVKNYKLLSSSLSSFLQPSLTSSLKTKCLSKTQIYIKLKNKGKFHTSQYGRNKICNNIMSRLVSKCTECT